MMSLAILAGAWLAEKSREDTYTFSAVGLPCANSTRTQAYASPTHTALRGPGESFLIPLAGEWFDRLYRKKRLVSHGFRFCQNAELRQNFQRVVQEEHRRRA